MAQPHEIRERMLIEPTSTHDERITKVPKVRYRPTEGGQPEPEKDEKDLACRSPAVAYARLRAAGAVHLLLPVAANRGLEQFDGVAGWIIGQDPT